MMSKKLTEMSNEELLKQEKTMKGVTFGFVIVLLMLFAATLFLMFKKGFRATTVTPVIFLPLFIINLKNWRDLKEEVKRRGL